MGSSLEDAGMVMGEGKAGSWWLMSATRKAARGSGGGPVKRPRDQSVKRCKYPREVPGMFISYSRLYAE